MTALRTRREKSGLSQRELAGRAGVAFRTVQLLERGGHDARLSTWTKLARALGCPAGGLVRAVEECFSGTGDSLAAVSARIATEGEVSWTGRVFDFVDSFRRRPALRLVEAPPSPDLPARLQALLTSVTEALCAEKGLPAPLWCAGVRPLARPWFVSGMESLKALALVESPVRFRRRNIFVLGNFLERA